VVYSCPASGFNSIPLIEYNEAEGKTKAYVEKSQSSQIMINELLSPHILRSFVCTPVTWISCGFEHCMVLTVYGTVASWGYGASGCLGHGNYISYTQPKLITGGDI
jgi:alpha-tubulin suppressor-like RCC1 family protein